MKSRILIVEDDVIVANNLRDRLTGLGYDVCGILFSGNEALEKVTEARPDLVLMDIRLKGDQDGIVTAQKLRQQFHLPVVYLTGYADEATLQRAKLSEPYGYILKPFEIRELHSTVEMALYKHAMELRLRESEQRYRTLVEHSLQGIMIIQGTPARIVFANAQVSLSTGYSAEALLDMSPSDAAALIHAEDRDEILSHLEDHLGERPAPASGSFRFVRRDGRLRWVQYFVSRVENAGGPALQVAFVDITARKAAETALQRAHDDLEIRVEERTAELVEVNERLRSEITVRRTAEQSLQQRNRELEMLHRVSQDLSASLNLRRVLTNALDEARHLLNAVGSTVWLVDPERDELTCWQATGPHRAVLHGWHLPIGEGFVGWVIRSGQSVLVADARKDSRHFKGIDQETGEEIRSLLCVPLKVADRLLGVLQVVDREPNRFETTDLALLEPLAASTAIAIENARLYTEADRLRRFNEGILQSMQEGILVEDTDGGFTYANPASEEMLGYGMGELYGLRWEQICADGFEIEVGTEAGRRPAQRNDRNETVLQTKEGRQIPVQVSRQPITLGDRTTGTLSVFMDITARKESEASLRRRAEQLRVLNELSHGVSASLSLEQVTEAALQGIGATIAPDLTMLFLHQDGELRLRGVFPQNHGWQQQATEIHRVGHCLCGLALEAAQPAYSTDIHADPRCTFQECKGAGMTSFAALPLLKGTEVLGVLGLASRVRRPFQEQDAFLRALTSNISIGLQNALLHREVQLHLADLERHVTQIRKAEEALLKSEERFRNLFENAPLCIFEVDLAQTPHNIVNCNRQAEAVYGWSRTEFASIGIDKLFADSNVPDHELVGGAIVPGEAITLESIHVRRDGSTFPVRISAAPASGPDGAHVILAVEDMTVEQSRRSEEQAIVEERRRIAREIHDGLAQNLASLRLQARLWHNLIDDDPERMHTEVDAMRDLLREQIRDVRRSIFALRPIALDELGFNRALQQFVQDFGEQNQLHIDLQIHGALEHLPSLLEPVLFRIIQEALNNVRKYAKANSVWIELGLEEADSLSLAVQDDGTGFDLAILDEAARFGHLGLRQMRERVEELDGSLVVDSQPGHGTQIRVLLPTFQVRGGV